jgi:arsenate reductase (glutaredoxin)
MCWEYYSREIDMEKVIIWHNPRCRKSREGLQYLQDKGVESEVFDYLNIPFSPEELAEIIKLSGQPVDEFIRRNEKEYKALGLNKRKLSIAEFAKICSKHPRLLQRLIVIKGSSAVLARPASKIDELL